MSISFFTKNQRTTKIVRECTRTGLQLLQGAEIGAAICSGEDGDQCITRLPQGTVITLPDQSTWRVDSGAWCAVIPKATPKANPTIKKVRMFAL